MADKTPLVRTVHITETSPCLMNLRFVGYCLKRERPRHGG
jgi:hypothetical protein